MAVDPTLRAIRREAREYRKHLATLTVAVLAYLSRLDTAMKAPASHARDQEIARLANALEMANDKARHFGLGIDLRTGRKAKVKKSHV